MSFEQSSNVGDARKKISLISILSFISCICALGVVLFNVISSVLSLFNNQNMRIFFGIVLVIFIVASVVLGIIDVCLKNRKKTLSIISLVISGGCLGLFMIVLFILTLYTSSGPTR